MESKRGPTDHELMLRCSEGDESAFWILVERWKDSLTRFMFSCTGNIHDAEELAQDVFVKVYRTMESYRPRAKFNTWLFTIARNTYRNWRRKFWNRAKKILSIDNGDISEEIPPDDSTRENIMRKDEGKNIVMKTLSCLPARQREALTLRVYEQMTYDEIAEVMNTSRSAIETLLFRARKNMRQKMKDIR